MIDTWGRLTSAALLLIGIMVPCYSLYGPPACPPTGYHQYPNDNCELYYACDNGTLLVLSCPLGQLYDRIFGRCRLAVLVQCALIPLPDLGPNSTTVIPTTETTYPATNPYSTQPTFTTTPTPTTTTSTTTATSTTPKTTTTTRTTTTSTTPKTTTRPTTTTPRPPVLCPPIGELIVPTGDCVTYYNCTNGKYVLDTCPTGDLLDPGTLQCKPFYLVSCFPATITPVPTTTKNPATTPIPSVCPATGSEIVPTGDCVTYYNCTNGQYVLDTCPTGDLLDPDTLHCKPFYLVSCLPATITPVPTTTKKPATTPTPSVCPATGSEIVPTGDCVTFYNCTNGKYTTENCPPGDLLDPQTLQCVPFYETSCKPVTTPKPTTPAPAICPSTGDVDIPTGDCFSYYQCSNGEYSIQKCSSGNLFDPQTLTCVPFYDTQCKPKNVKLSRFILPYV